MAHILLYIDTDAAPRQCIHTYTCVCKVSSHTTPCYCESGLFMGKSCGITIYVTLSPSLTILKPVNSVMKCCAQVSCHTSPLALRRP